jgi:hypothetical protein
LLARVAGEIFIAGVKEKPLSTKLERSYELENRSIEQNQSKRALAERTRGGFYFHPSDEDLSLGARVRKKPL